MGCLEEGPGCLLGQGDQGGRGAPSLQEVRGALMAPTGLQWGEEEPHEGRALRLTIQTGNGPEGDRVGEVSRGL